MPASRRDFFRLGLGMAAGWMASCETAGGPAPQVPARPLADPASGGPPLPVETPDLPKLPWTWDHGVKVFRLTCDVVKSRFVPWREFNTWGYNGSTPGPTVEAIEGDRVRFVVENRLPEATTVHWHGLEVAHEMDGAEGISQDLIPPGGRFVYEFTLHQHGTFFYHSHRPMQQMMGMVGLFVIHPRQPYEPRVDRDFAWILQGWAALPGNPTPNSMAMEFNWLTMNGKAAPATTPVLCKLGERVRLRFVNLGMDHHPMHLHGHTWVVTGTEGGRVPAVAWTPGNTEIVGVAQARTLELVANNPGDWMIHCHLPHHMTNSMASMAGPLTAPAAGVGPASDTGPAPGYPQDMFMAMDDRVAKPETQGLRPGWTGGMMGMMTLLRVLRPARYAEILALKASLVLAILLSLAAVVGAADAPAPATVHLAELESRALQHNPALAAAESALRAVDEQLQKAGPGAAKAGELAQTRSHLLVERQRMLVKFRTLFFHTLANQRRVESRERLAGLAREATGVTAQLWNVGAADGPDRLAVENEAQALDAALADARFELEQMRTLLQETVGEPGLELGPLEGDLIAELPKLDRDEWRQRLLRESPSLQEVRDEIAKDEAALAQARRDRRGLAAAEAALAEARLRAEQVRITLEVGFAETFAGYQSGLRQIAAYHGGALERAERAYQENLDHYRHMTAAYPQVLIAQRNLLQMEDAELDAVIKAWSAAIDIQALLPYELPQNLAPRIAAPAAPAPSDGDSATPRTPSGRS